MSTHLFRLFVAGASPRSFRAQQSLEALVAAALPDEREVIEVIDVLERPDLAEEAGVVATPLVVRERPLPTRRVVGDLSDPFRLADALGLDRPLRSISKERPT
ncbi:MAG: circadian clock protein KaiB [Nocardioides sp.]|nr:circadian clock protein KaiB [Nocardioides sp.]